MLIGACIPSGPPNPEGLGGLQRTSYSLESSRGKSCAMARMEAVATLSVCCPTRDPPARLKAILEVLGGVADEVVIGADSRVCEEDLREYENIADRVLRLDFATHVEPHLTQLYRLCSGDWILRLDGDEVPSEALLRALPRLLNASTIRQYWLPRRWLAASGYRWLDELPWAPDYHNRLVRNDNSVVFSGRIHSGAEPTYPARYLHESIYHLVCALETRDERLVRGLRYELAQPLRTAPGGGPFNATYYLPERFARCEPVDVPNVDRPLLRAALEAVQ
jgi:hypothetical protein